MLKLGDTVDDWSLVSLVIGAFVVLTQSLQSRYFPDRMQNIGDTGDDWCDLNMLL